MQNNKRKLHNLKGKVKLLKVTVRNNCYKTCEENQYCHELNALLVIGVFMLKLFMHLGD